MISKKLKLFFSIILIAFFSTVQAQSNKNPNAVVVLNHYSMRPYNRIIQQFYKQNKNSHSPSLSKRVNADSKLFWGKPYHLGALGEGYVGEFDQSPLYRTDEFDCVTYVETVLALLESNSLKQFRDHILDIRYSNGYPTFLTRNHFTSVDWNINNEKNGYVTQYTKKLFPKSYKIATTEINKPNWYANLPIGNLKQIQNPSLKKANRLLIKLHDLGKKTQIEKSNLPYVPLISLYTSDGKPKQFMFDKIPNDVIIEIVRPNWNLTKEIGTHLNVSHLGFGIRSNNILYYREASSKKMKVTDVPLERYLAGYLNSPTVKGISILLINYPVKKE